MLHLKSNYVVHEWGFVKGKYHPLPWIAPTLRRGRPRMGKSSCLRRPKACRCDSPKTFAWSVWKSR